MADIDKVIKGLTECVAAGLENACPPNCPYFLQCFPDVGLATPFVSLMADALSLLKEQEAVVRCKDCRKNMMCEMTIHKPKDWFCADGERRDDNA